MIKRMKLKSAKSPASRVFIVLVIIAGAAVIAVEMWQASSSSSKSSSPATEQVALVHWHRDYAKALKFAKQVNKPLLLDFYATWCGPCQRMDAQVYSHPPSADYINLHFVPVQIDLSNGGPSPIARKLGVRALPTLAIQSPDGKTIAKSVGYRGRSYMMNWVKENEVN